MNRNTLNSFSRMYPKINPMYLVKTPRLIQGLFPNFTWRVPTQEKTLYLTFDEGPNPEITPWILEQLAQYNAKATFFLIGKKVEKFPELLHQIISEGHSVGNNTHTNVDAWGMDNIPFFHDVRHCARLVKSSLFRPPYGKLKPSQAQFLQRHYRIVMWDVMSGDFDESISNEQCLENVVKNATKGSIVVFHNSSKAKEKLQYALPRVLEYFSSLGYSFDSLNNDAFAKQVLKSA